MSHDHVAYGLSIRSAVPLGSPSKPIAEPDLRIDVRRSGHEPVPADATAILRADAEEVEVHWAQGGRCIVRRGRRAIIDAADGADDDALRLFILGSVIPVALFQRGMLVLHASGVLFDGGVIAFAGSSGRGKSTIAASFHRNGHRLVSDDIIPVAFDDDGVWTSAGFAQARLWPDSAAAIGADASELRPLHPELRKNAWAPSHDVPSGRLPLRAIYILAAASEGDIEPIRGRQALLELIGNCYTARLPAATGRSAEHFQQCARLLDSVPVRRLPVAPTLAGLPELLERVQADLGGSSRIVPINS